MKINSIVFNSEIEFRESVIYNYNYIDKIYIFEDSLDNIIYFYCFLYNKSFFATKTYNNDFIYYSTIYKKLQKELKISFESKNPKILKLKK